MQKLLSLFLAAVVLCGLTTSEAFAATKKNSIQRSKICVECRSRAEGADTFGARATHWKGTIIGINEGAHSFIITEATQLNHIKAYEQRYVEIGETTQIKTSVGEEKKYNDIDIGYVINVKGTYNAKQRTISASSLEVLEIPDELVMRTK